MLKEIRPGYVFCNLQPGRMVHLIKSLRGHLIKEDVTVTEETYSRGWKVDYSCIWKGQNKQEEIRVSLNVWRDESRVSVEIRVTSQDGIGKEALEGLVKQTKGKMAEHSAENVSEYYPESMTLYGQSL